MAITLTCPRCMHKQKIDDDKAGKEVPCKVCHHGIKPAGANGKGKTKLAAKEEPKEPKSTGIKSGPPAGKGSKTSPPSVPNSKSKKTAQKEEGEGNSILMFALIGGGVFALFLFLCAGGGVGAYFLFRSDPNQQVAQNDNNQDPNANANPGFDPIAVNNNPPVIIIPPGGNQFIPPLNANDPKEINTVIAYLKGANQEERTRAFDWLQTADPAQNRARQSEVAKLLDAMVDQQKQQPFQFSFFPAYFRWATKDNSATMIRLVEGDNQRRQQAIITLGKLKETTAAEAIAKYLPDFFVRQQAADALKEIGPAALPFVIKHFNHTDANLRDTVRRLVANYNPKTEVIVDQCLLDLNSAEIWRRDAALQWFAMTPAEPSRRVQVAKAFNTLLQNDNNSMRNNNIVSALERVSTENLPGLLPFHNHPDMWLRTPGRKLLKAANVSSEALLTQTIADLESFDANRRRAAMQWLGETPADPAKKLEISRSLNKCIEGENSFFANNDLVKALENWGTSENVAKLVPILDQARLRRDDIVRILGKIRDPNGIKAVARRLGNFFDKAEVQKVLKECGPLAEPAVVEVMTTTMDKNTRVECARLLGEIGTKAVAGKALNEMYIRLNNPQIPQFQRETQFLQVSTAAFQAINQRGK